MKTFIVVIAVAVAFSAAPCLAQVSLSPDKTGDDFGDFLDTELNLRSGITSSSLAVLQGDKQGMEDGVKKAVAAQRRLAGVYLRAAGSEIFLQSHMSSILGEYYRGVSNARSAPQISQQTGETAAKLAFMQVAQNQKLIEQNDKIIALLEKIAKK